MAGCGPLTRLAQLLGMQAKMPVLDKTGLDGSWLHSTRFGSLPDTNRAVGADPSLPPYEIALQEQLQVRLFIAKRKAEIRLAQDADFYICSLSCRSVVYKGLFLAESLADAPSVISAAGEYYLLQQDDAGNRATISEGSFDGQNVTFFNVALEEGVYYLGWKNSASC